jgi:peroxiredoxin Q/BCP
MAKLGTYLRLARHALGQLVNRSGPRMLAIGTAAPDFTVSAHDGTRIRLSDLRGRKVILWFYPKADTPGWTIQGNGFRDRIRDFEAKHVQILGCSFDTPAENRAFAEKLGYTFPLLCDTDRRVAIAYGAADGPDTAFPRRITYVIDEGGVIIHTLDKVSPNTHTDQMLAAIGWTLAPVGCPRQTPRRAPAQARYAARAAVSPR